jgi:hypothetical protein
MCEEALYWYIQANADNNDYAPLLSANPWPITGQYVVPGIPVPDFSPPHLGPKTSLNSILTNMTYDHRSIHIAKNRNGRIRLNREQLKTVSRGFFCELSLLDPILTLLQVNEDVRHDINRFCSIIIKTTRTDVMTTNLAQVEVNMSEMAICVLRDGVIELISIKIPVFGRTKPIINRFLDFIDSVVDFRFCFQAGTQKSDSINFNMNLGDERQKIDYMEHCLYNRTIMPLRRAQANFGVTRIPAPIHPNPEEVHFKLFTDKKWYFWFNIDLNKVIDYLIK